MKDTAKTKSCTCWSSINERIEKQGVRLSSSLSQLQVQPSLDLLFVHVMPLERLDGKKLKRSQPATIAMKHCPFCGQKF
jgi:hypothetical protein